MAAPTARELVIDLGDAARMHVVECSVICRNAWVALSVDRVRRAYPTTHSVDLRAFRAHITVGYFNVAPDAATLSQLSVNLNRGLQKYLADHGAVIELIAAVAADDPSIDAPSHTYMAFLLDDQRESGAVWLLRHLQRVIRAEGGSFFHPGKFHLSLS